MVKGQVKNQAKRSRESKLLKFPEIQTIVNDILWDYIHDNYSSYSQIARNAGVSKSRFSDIKKTDKCGRFKHLLPETLLEPLIWEDIVPLKKIEAHIDLTDPQKVLWLHYQRYKQDLKKLRDAKYPTEKIDEMFAQMKKEAGVK